VEDNWALMHALAVARRRGVPVAIAFSLAPDAADDGAGARQRCFMLRGLREMESKLHGIGLPFYLLAGDPGVTVPALAAQLSASLLVADFSPLREGRQWRAAVAAGAPVDVPVHEVDAHNVVPVWVTSDKQEYAARTIRPKLNKRLGEFLTEFPTLADIRAAAAAAAAAAGAARRPGPDVRMCSPDPIDWQALIAAASVGAAPEVWSAARRREPGEAAARAHLAGAPHSFLPNRLRLYEQRNDPNIPHAQSGLSPYLHFGRAPHGAHLGQTVRELKAQSPEPKSPKPKAKARGPKSKAQSPRPNSTSTTSNHDAHDLVRVRQTALRAK
jgi:deoxyribodipyrimidine photo-lyase